MSAEGVINKGTKGGYAICKFHAGGFVKPNHSSATIGCNSGGETVNTLSIAAVKVSVANGAFFTVKRGANTVLVLGDSGEFDLMDFGQIDSFELTANVVVTKTGSGPSTLLMKLRKGVSITGGSQY